LEHRQNDVFQHKIAELQRLADGDVTRWVKGL